MSLWSHRCNHRIHGENNIEGCKKVVDYGFSGIEVDVQYHENKFYIHHDHWYLAKNQTLKQLLELDLGVDLWVDMKTSLIDSIPIFIELVKGFKHRLIVEVYKKHMIEPFQNANLTVSSTQFNTEFRSISGRNYVLFGTDRLPVGTWQMDRFCLNDAFFADGGDVVVTDFYKPYSCDSYIPILLWRLSAWIIILGIGTYGMYLLLKKIYKCRRLSNYDAL
jgi:hypothetical protein